MKKNVIITVLSVVALLLAGTVGYLVVYKIINKDKNFQEQESKEQTYELALAEELVKKYASNSRFLGGDIFSEDLTEPMKMLITFRSASATSVDSALCSLIYGEGYEKSSYGEYFIPLDTPDNISAVCNNTVESIHYFSVDYIYKKLFGTDMPKKDMSIGTHRFDYNEERNTYYLLDCNCGGVDARLTFYGVKSSKLIDDELVINVVHSMFEPDDESERYIADFDETLELTGEELNNEQEVLKKYSDKMNKYKFTFKKENNDYILRDVSKVEV